MTSPAHALYALITEVRGTFRDLAAFGDRLYADLGVTTARRAVLEYLVDNGPETVANMARAKNLSRQHIQQLTDALVAADLARYAANPAHKRSQLVQLSDAGMAVFAEIRRREAGHLQRLAAALPPAALAEATRTLSALRAGLAETDSPNDPKPENEGD